jgi:hypothetical protein
MSTPDFTPFDDPASESPQDRGEAITPPGVEYRELVLVKQGQRYIFRYSAGQEARLLEGLSEMAGDPRNDLDWFDAAVLSHQMGQDMSAHLAQMNQRPRRNGAA